MRFKMRSLRVQHIILGVLLLLSAGPASSSSNIFDDSRNGDDDDDNAPLLIDENTTWTTSFTVDRKIIVFPGSELRIEGTPDNKVLLNYQFDCIDPNSYYYGSVNTSIGFALHERSTLIMKHVEITATCTDRTGPVVYYLISGYG